MTQLPWQFEPCDPDGARDAAHMPWAHAVRGRREQGRTVTGYGHTEPLAYEDARQEAQKFDAREVLGIKIVVLSQYTAPIDISAPWQMSTPITTIVVLNSATGEEITRGRLDYADFRIMPSKGSQDEALHVLLPNITE